MSESERDRNSERFNLFKAFLSPEKIPGVAGVIVGIIFAISNWNGAIEMLVPGLQTLGGGIAAVVDILSSPAPPILLIFWSAYYLWLVSHYQLTPRQSIGFQVFSWMLPLVFVSALCSVALFGVFIRSSEIPQIKSYVRYKTYERHVDRNKYNQNFSSMTQVSTSIPQFPVFCVPDREAIQYASEIIKALRDAGFNITKPASNAELAYPDMPEIINVPFARVSGIQIYSKDNFEARRAANSLASVLENMGVKASVGNSLSSDGAISLGMFVGDR